MGALLDHDYGPLSRLGRQHMHTPRSPIATRHAEVIRAPKVGRAAAYPALFYMKYASLSSHGQTSRLQPATLLLHPFLYLIVVTTLVSAAPAFKLCSIILANHSPLWLSLYAA